MKVQANKEERGTVSMDSSEKSAVIYISSNMNNSIKS